MNHTLLISAVIATLSLVACERDTVVTPPATVVVPGPAGPTGATGDQGATGSQGATGTPGDQGAPGKTGDGSTIIVMPPASAPAN